MGNTNFTETMVNIEKALLGDGEHSHVAKMIDYGNGYLTEILSSDRTYYEVIRVDEVSEVVLLEISPGINCAEPYRSQMAEYIMKINAIYKCGNFRMDHNGNVHAHLEQSFEDAPVSGRTIKGLERKALSMCIEYEKKIDKVAHGQLLMEEENSKKLELLKQIMRKKEERKHSLEGENDVENEEEDKENTSIKLEEILGMFSEEDDEKDLEEFLSIPDVFETTKNELENEEEECA